VPTAIAFRLRTWLSRNGDVVAVTLAALAVRLVWNLGVHRPTSYAFSDMGGYLDRGARMVEHPWETDPELALFPYGTHAFIGALRWISGRWSDTAIDAGFAVLGALAVAYTQATAARFVTRRWARLLLGALLVVYYPWISLGGYALSEILFALCVAAAAFHGLRLADRGRPADATLLGLSLALGATVRPQILVAVALLGGHLLLRRRAWHGASWRLVPRVALPLLLVLGLSSYRLHRHTGRLGLVSANAPMNLVFGRCHNTGLDAVAPDRTAFFGPPAFGALLHHERRGERPLFTLDPALGERLAIEGHMWDAEPSLALARACVTETGYARQLRYALTHVVLLWTYNSIWPDMGSPRWGRVMDLACLAHDLAFVWATVVALLLSFQRRRARWMLLSLHVLSLVITAAVFFGDTRYRAPYDGVIMILALQVYVEAGSWIETVQERLAAVGRAGAGRWPRPSSAPGE
jgi:hypothetical protein